MYRELCFLQPAPSGPSLCSFGDHAHLQSCARNLYHTCQDLLEQPRRLCRNVWTALKVCLLLRPFEKAIYRGIVPGTSKQRNRQENYSATSHRKCDARWATHAGLSSGQLSGGNHLDKRLGTSFARAQAAVQQDDDTGVRKPKATWRRDQTAA